MIRSAKIVFFCLFISPVIMVAQDSTRNYFHKNNYYDLALAAGSNQFSEAISWTHLHSFGKRKRIKVGYGIRFTNCNGVDKMYTTAPAELTSTKQNLGTIFSDNIPDNIDTITFNKTQVNFINLVIHLQYTYKKFDLNFNIDAIGLSFGNKPTGNYSVSHTADSRMYNSYKIQSASVAPYNALLTSDNDIGSLNSEFNIRYWLSKNIAIRAGFCFIFTEYLTNNKLRLDNDRFRYKSKMGLIGITYSPFHN